MKRATTAADVLVPGALKKFGKKPAATEAFRCTIVPSTRKAIWQKPVRLVVHIHSHGDQVQMGVIVFAHPDTRAKLWRQYPLAALMTLEVIFTPMDDQNFSKNVRDPSLLR